MGKFLIPEAVLKIKTIQSSTTTDVNEVLHVIIIIPLKNGRESESKLKKIYCPCGSRAAWQERERKPQHSTKEDFN